MCGSETLNFNEPSAWDFCEIANMKNIIYIVTKHLSMFLVIYLLMHEPFGHNGLIIALMIKIRCLLKTFV